MDFDSTKQPIKEYRECAATLQNWSKSVLNTFDYPYTNGFTEGRNNKVEFLKRTAYGYRKFDRFKKEYCICLAVKILLEIRLHKICNRHKKFHYSILTPTVDKEPQKIYRIVCYSVAHL